MRTKGLHPLYSKDVLPRISNTNSGSKSSLSISIEEELVKKLEFLAYIDYSKLREEFKDNLFYQSSKSFENLSSCDSKSQRLTNLEGLNEISLVMSLQTKINEKLNSITLENRLKQELNYIALQIKDLSEIRADFISHIMKKSGSIENFRLDVEYLLKIHPLVKYKDYVNNIIYKSLVQGINFNEIFDMVLTFTKSIPQLRMCDLKNETQIQINQIRGRMEERRSSDIQKINLKLKEEIESRAHMIDELKSVEFEISQYRTAEKELKAILVTHYHKLLSEGRDTRGVGLIWIIKEIYLLGYDVITSFMPKFLDDKAVVYLFLYAQSVMKMQSIKDKLCLMKQQLKFMNTKYFEKEKILQKLNIESPQENVKQLIEILPNDNRPNGNNANSHNYRFDSQSTDLESHIDSTSDQLSKTIFKIIESPTITHKVRSKTQKALETIPELKLLQTPESFSNLKSSTSASESVIPTTKYFSLCRNDDNLARIERIKKIKKKQDKMNRYIDAELNLNMSETQKKFFVVEKAIRTGISESEETNISFKSLGNYLDSKCLLNPESIELIKKITSEDYKLKLIAERITELKRNEMQRIFNEILKSDYLRRFKTTKKMIISALIGEESLMTELLRQDQETKVN